MPTPTPPPIDIALERDKLWATATRLETGGWVWLAQGIKALVATSKGDR